MPSTIVLALSLSTAMAVNAAEPVEVPGGHGYAAGDANAAEAAERMRPKKGKSTGELADGYKVDMGVASPAKSEGGPRHAGIVYNDVDYAAVIELGGENPHIEGQHVLERAAAPWHVPYGIRRALGSGK